jgi:hypothetical protein
MHYGNSGACSFLLCMIYYRATKESCAVINSNELLLIDSGGQYLDGTTGFKIQYKCNNKFKVS